MHHTTHIILSDSDSDIHQPHVDAEPSCGPVSEGPNHRPSPVAQHSDIASVAPTGPSRRPSAECVL
eukprot:1205890-Amphidinium_carterae.1